MERTPTGGPSSSPVGPPLKIVYIIGWCRNGSTILGNVLGEVPGFFHTGELHFLWKNAAGLGANHSCGCGQPLTSCPLWSRIIPLGQPAGVSAETYARLVMRRQSRVRTRHTRRVLRQGLRTPGVRAHAALMTQVYRGIAERAGARVIVDTTKIPGEAALVEHMPGLTPWYVHLVRDPRAIAESWRERKQYCDPMPASRSTAYWTSFNLASAAVTRRHPERSMFLRYETFIADPQRTIDRLLRWCGEDPAANPVHGRTVDLHPNHTVTGNPDRFRSGVTVIRDTDDAWRATLPARSRRTAEALSWPLSHRYGYSGRERPPHPAAPARAATAQVTDEPQPR